LAAPAVLAALALACAAVPPAALRALLAVALAPLLAVALVRFAAGLAAVEDFFELDDERFGAGMLVPLAGFAVARAYPNWRQGANYNYRGSDSSNSSSAFCACRRFSA
jgi:hypothetical protein